ncbi:MAG: hypothetical protein SVZ03_01960 [Spirochaetota bacterium]|nr:hypothetical protein [Spirochaetota bacterium]
MRIRFISIALLLFMAVCFLNFAYAEKDKESEDDSEKRVMNNCIFLFLSGESI